MGRKSSFYYSFLILPAEKRRALTAVFDICRAIDDSVDLEPDPDKARDVIDQWRADIARVFSPAGPATPEGRALQPFVEPFRLPRASFEALIDGVAMDAAPRRYQTFTELEPYCHRVASAVGLICLEIFGYRDAAARDYARDLGVALQLTNILRDVGVDYRRGRVYLPVEDMTRFGVTEDDIAREVAASGRGVQSERLRAVLEYQAARARLFFARAERQLPAADANRLAAAEIMGAIYRDLLRRIEHARCDVFAGVIRVPRPVQARIALGTWWRSRRT